MAQEPQRKKPSIGRIALGTALLWTATLGGLLAWSIRGERQQCTDLARTQTRAFFQEFLMTRFWNAMHNGVYVVVTEETQPNPFLKDDPLRDLRTTGGMLLTKLNPAYMTRQISDIAKQRSRIVFHLTGLNPINPGNAPDPWEEKALRQITGRGEQAAMTTTPEGEKIFRYISPLLMESKCLDCHKHYGDTLGSGRGGISVTIPAQPLIDLQYRQIGNLVFCYGTIWLLGMLAIGICARRMGKHEKERTGLIAELQQSLQEVKQLSGLLPICCSCKNIRDDQGYWKKVEQYMSEHTDVQFTHGICPDCAKKLYPELHPETLNLV